MKLAIYNISKSRIGEKDLPEQFKEELRPDLIKRAVLAIQSNKRQPYGSKPGAGMRHSAKLSRRRRKYKGAYGIGISRVSRKILSRRGTRFNWAGANSPGTVGGRRAHPPKATKIWEEKINKKERRKAIRSAISATILSETVKQRGHIIPDDYPFLIEDKVESIAKSKELKKVLETIGLKQELERASKVKLRAGKGKLRGRKYIKKIGPLIVVSKPCRLMKSAKNIPGIKVVEVKKINTELLAPRAVPGRLTLWTDKAIDVLSKEKLFLNKK